MGRTQGLNVVETLHYTFRWNWPITDSEAHRIAARFDLPLHVGDITEKFLLPADQGGLLGLRGKPCNWCKTVTYPWMLTRCRELGVDVFATGYNASDSIARDVELYCLRQTGKRDDMELCAFSKYIPNAIFHELRPLIRLNDNEVWQLAEQLDLRIQRTHEAGRMKYWREGCPIQYVDEDAVISQDLLERLWHVNQGVSKYARQQGSRASVFLPSGRIITMPEGWENAVANIVRQIDERIGLANGHI